MGKSLFEKVWDDHTVHVDKNGQTLLIIDKHVVHEVTSPQAYAGVKKKGLKIMFPDRILMTADHIVETKSLGRPFKDEQNEKMMSRAEENAEEFGIKFFGLDSENQGIVHVAAPEVGFIHPGDTACCGDSHTSTIGAFGTIAFGVGTSEVEKVFVTQCLTQQKPPVCRITINGKLQPGVEAKDLILALIGYRSASGGNGMALEYFGEVFSAMSMEERMTVCNMSIEGGARCGYVNPDLTTIEYLRGRMYVPRGEEFEVRSKEWLSYASDEDAVFDEEDSMDGSAIAPQVTFGTNAGITMDIDGTIPKAAPKNTTPEDYQAMLDHMDLKPGDKILDQKVDVVFIGSCTNSRMSDMRVAADLIKKTGVKVQKGVRALIVPGSQQVKKQCKAEGLDELFMDHGFEWRGAGCSMCLAMNSDKLEDFERCASTSNRNFIGRQGSKKSRTHLVSISSAVAAAGTGVFSDARQLVS